MCAAMCYTGWQLKTPGANDPQMIHIIRKAYNALLTKHGEKCNNKLSSLIDYSFSNTADYNNVDAQELYILRYLYAYAYEYKQMYSALLECVTSEHINIASVGCGNMVDEWALGTILSSKSYNTKTAEYIGYDIVPWEDSYWLIEDGYVLWKYIHSNFAHELIRDKAVIPDVYCFPKSIGEIKYQDFNTICDFIESNQNKKETTFIVASIRETQALRDKERLNQITEALQRGGFKLTLEHEGRKEYETLDKRINFYDNSFPPYPIYASSYCNMICGRYPTLTPKHIYFIVKKFERKK